MNGNIWRCYAQEETTITDKMGVSIDEILSVYLTERIKNNGTLASARRYCDIASQHLGTATLKDLVTDPSILVRYFAGAKFPPRWAPKTLYNYRLNLRAAIGYWIKSRGLSCVNPLNVVFLDPQTAIREIVPTPEQYFRLRQTALDVAPAYVADIITAAWETGLRMSEYLSWTWADLNLGFADGLPWYTVRIRKQKRMVARQIPMSQGLWEMLSNRRAANRFQLWPCTTAPYRHLRRVALSAGLPGLHLHDFRKSYKTYRKSEGWPSSATMAIQGHATDSMDRYYTVFGRHHLNKFVAQQWDEKLLREKNIFIPLDKQKEMG